MGITDAQIEAAADALDKLVRIGRGLQFKRHELREAAKAVLTAASRVEIMEWCDEIDRLVAAREPGYAPLTEKQRARLRALRAIGD
jgi:hypothetical protein